MKFSAKDISVLTFPTSALAGYKKHDVDDFLFYVEKDYRDFQLEVAKLQQQLEDAEKEQKRKEVEIEIARSEQKQIQQQAEEEKAALSRQLLKKTASAETKSNAQETLQLSQGIALEIEKKAEGERQRILAEAKEQEAMILQKAEVEKQKLLAEVQMEAAATAKQLEAERQQLLADTEKECQRLRQENQVTLKELRARADNYLKEAEAEKAKGDRYYERQCLAFEKERVALLEELSKDVTALKLRKHDLLGEIEDLERSEKLYRESLAYEYKKALVDLQEEKWQQRSQKWETQLKKIVE